MGLFGSPESKLLRLLETSDLFSEGFPRRQKYSHSKWATLSEEERSKIHAPGIAAIRRVKGWQTLVEAVQALAKVRHMAAVPILSKLWADCALQPVRVAAGHALRAIGTPEARAALQAELGDADHLSVFLAVHSVFESGAKEALELFMPYFDPRRVQEPGGAAVPQAVLNVFAPSSIRIGSNGKEEPQWSDPRAPEWFRQDPRWLDLCIRLRKDEHLGMAARSVLQAADQDFVQAALKKALEREVPRVLRVQAAAVGDLVTRYRRGDYEAVWEKLRSYETIAGDLLEEARAVAEETMKRVVRAVNPLAERLSRQGWKPLYAELRTIPRSDDAEVFRRIEEMTGAPIPLSLRAFWEIVGGINFVWNYELDERPNLGVELDIEEMDPICVDPPSVVTHSLDSWEDAMEGVDPELADPLHLDLAPDYLHKANISGGEPYGVTLPFRGVDPIFDNEEHRLPFIDYLRLSIRWGGFPRLERYGDCEDVRMFVERMTKDVEPF